MVCHIIALTASPNSIPPTSSCTVLGVAPAFTPFMRECHSYLYSDGDLVPQTELLAGLGAWGCFLSYSGW